MDRREGLLLGLGTAAAAAAVALAILLGRGTVDSPEPPPSVPAAPGTPPAPKRRDIPDLVLPAGFPAAAGETLRRTWAALVEAGEEEGVRALAATTPSGPGGPFDGCAPAALEAFAPTLEVLITGPEGPLAAAAMRSAAALTRLGGDEGRRTLARTGLVERGFALQATTARLELRVETARLMGFVGGKAAVEWLVIFLGKAGETEVRAAAASALGEAYGVDRGLPREALMALRDAMARPGEDASVRRALIRTASRAFPSLAPYEIGGAVAAALEDASPATRLEAALFLQAHPLEAAGPALVRALADRDPRIVEPVADALAQIRPPGAREALLERRRDLSDPAALRSVDRALAVTGPGK